LSSIGARLRAAREDAGVTLSALATRTHFSVGYLSNVERGERPASPGVILAYERELDPMQRRGLLAGLAASAVAPAAVAELIRSGFTAALDGRDSVEFWLDRAQAYGREYMTDGAAVVQGRLAKDLVVIQQHLEHPQMWAASARLLTTYGKTATSRTEAVNWYRLAAVLADRSEDVDTRVWVRGRAALALAYEAAELASAERLARQALAIDDRPTLGRLNATVGLAHVAGVRGDREGALALLEDARRIHDRAGSDDGEISDFAVPEWRLHTFASMLLSRMGDPGAVAEQDAADATRPVELTRFATHIQLHRALGLVRSGDREAGLELARAALGALPPERHSLSLRLMLAEIEAAAA
jgi:transcriptional regulator with XRE-family HTH domain